jgi:Fur family transcriptional regulator, ferric uptake regulator
MNKEKLLKGAGLRKTSARLMILEFLERSAGAQALGDLERELGELADRATLYRTLKSFEDSGLVHRVVDPAGVLRFALCGHQCSEGDSHRHGHVHFSCDTCGQLTCLEQIVLPDLSLPTGFQVKDVQLVYSGVCSVCAAN